MRIHSVIASHAEKLTHFFAIANARSMQAAARTLGISAPSLFTSIKTLESALDAPLFVRRSTGVTLTSAGQTLYSFCLGYFCDIADLEESIRRGGVVPLRRVRVGTYPSIASYLWPNILAALSEERLSLSLTTQRSKVILELLELGDVELSITVGMVRHPRIVACHLFDDHYSLYVSRTSPVSQLSKKMPLNTQLFLFRMRKMRREEVLSLTFH